MAREVSFVVRLLDKFSDIGAKYVKTLSSMTTMADKFENNISAIPKSVNGLSERLKDLSSQRDKAFDVTEIKGFNRQIQAVENELTNLQSIGRTPIAPTVNTGGLQNLTTFAKNALGSLGLLAAGSMAISFGNESVDYAATISDGMASVAKTTGMADDKMLQFRKNLQGLDTRTNLVDLLKIGEIGGQIGIAEKDILGFTTIVDQLNIAFKGKFAGGAEEITNKIGGLANMFPQLKASGMGVAEIISRIGSSINELDATGMADAPFIADFVSRAAPAFKALNPETLLGWAAGMQEMNMTSENAASGARGFFQYVFKDSEKFAKVMKMNKAEMLNMFNTDEGTQKFLVNFGKVFKTMDVVQSRLALQDLGVKEISSQDFIQNIMTLQNTKGQNNPSLNRIEEIIGVSGKGMKENTSISKEFDKMNNTLAANIEKANKKYDESKLKLGEMLAPLKLQAMELGGILLDKVIGIFETLETKKGLFESLAVGAGVFAGALVLANIPAMALAGTQMITALTNPFTLTIMGAAALAAGMAYLYYHSETVRGTFWALYEGGKVVFEGLYNVGKVHIGGLMDIFGGLLNMVVGVFDTVSALFSLDWSKMGDGLSKIGGGMKQNLTGMFNATIGTGIATIGESYYKSPQLSQAMGKGYTNGVNDFRVDNAPKQAGQESIMKTGAGGFGTGVGLEGMMNTLKGAIPGGAMPKIPMPDAAKNGLFDNKLPNALTPDDGNNQSLSKGIDTIAGGGSKPTTYNITIGKLIETSNVHTQTFKEGADEIEEKLTEMLLRVVNGANQAN
jgi:TP901 family phage tail tape measure protein